MSWMKIIIVAVLAMVPYIPLIKYAEAWMAVSAIEKTLLADVNRLRSSEFPMSHCMMAEPTSNWSINPAVTIGPMPSSMSVPRFEANITLKAVYSLPTSPSP